MRVQQRSHLMKVPIGFQKLIDQLLLAMPVIIHLQTWTVSIVLFVLGLLVLKYTVRMRYFLFQLKS